MIGLETHRQTKDTVRQLPKEMQARVESPRPGKRFRFFGPEVQVDVLQISVAPEIGQALFNTHAVTRAFTKSRLTREDRGRSISNVIPVPLQYRGSSLVENQRRLLTFEPTDQLPLQ